MTSFYNGCQDKGGASPPSRGPESDHRLSSGLTTSSVLISPTHKGCFHPPLSPGSDTHSILNSPPAHFLFNYPKTHAPGLTNPWALLSPTSTFWSNHPLSFDFITSSVLIWSPPRSQSDNPLSRGFTTNSVLICRWELDNRF